MSYMSVIQDKHREQYFMEYQICQHIIRFSIRQLGLPESPLNIVCTRTIGLISNSLTVPYKPHPQRSPQPVYNTFIDIPVSCNWCNHIREHNIMQLSHESGYFKSHVNQAIRIQSTTQ